MFKIIFLAIGVYALIMCFFMIADVLTGYGIPFISDTADKLASIGLVIMLVLCMAAVCILVYGVIASGFSVTEAMK